MKFRRHVGAILLIMLILCLVACGNEDPAQENAAVAAANASYSGTIVAMRYDSLTLSTESGEITVALTDATTYSYDAEALGFGAMGGMMNMPDGDMQKPDGDMEPPEGMNGEGAEMPENTFIYDVPEGLPETDPEGIRDIPEPGEAETEFRMTVETLTLGSAVTVETDASGSAFSVTLTSSTVLDSFGGIGGMMGTGGFGDASGFDRLDGTSD